MRFKSTWIVIALFAALAAYFFLVEEPRHQARQEAETTEGLVFPGFQPDEVTAVVVTGEKGRVRAVRGEDGEWSVTEPWDDRADDGRIRNLLSDLETLQAEREVAASDAALAPYGLEDPAATVATEGAGARLAVGAQNPAGDARYVRAGEGPVRLASQAQVSGLLLEPEDLRSKIVIDDFPWAKLEAVTIRRPGEEEIRLVKADGEWRLAAPVEAEADPEEARRVAEKLRWVRIQNFPAPEERGEAEEALAGGIAVVLEAEGEAAPVTVRLAPADGAAWARRTGRDALFTLPPDAIEAFRVTPLELRRRRPLRVEAPDVSKLRLARGDEAWTFEKAENLWEREGKRLEGEEFSAFRAYLDTLAETVALEVIDDGGPGFDDPTLAVTVWDASGTERRAALVREGDEVYARGGEEGPVYRMPPAYLADAEALIRAASAAPSEAAEEPAPPEGGEE